MFKKIIIGTGAATVVGNVAGYIWARQKFGEDGVERIIEYDKLAVPCAIEYKLLEAKCEKFPNMPILSMFFPKVSIEEEQKQFEIHLNFSMIKLLVRLKPLLKMIMAVI